MDDIILIDSQADFCLIPGNDCDHAKISNISVQSLKKDARHFRIRNIRIRKSDEALSLKPFRSNNNIPMGRRLY